MALALRGGCRARSLRFLNLSYMVTHRFNRVSAGISRWGVVGIIALCGLVSSVWLNFAKAEPPYPWRSGRLSPAPSTQRQTLAPAPRSRGGASGTPALLSQSLPQPHTESPEPTPVDPPASPLPRSRRTYYTARRPEALFPSGHGLHIAVSQQFLDELIRVESHDAGPVRDCILGAEVVGSQQTETAVHVRLVPSSSTAQMEFQLTGTTRNSTENRTRQAFIESEGNHRFEVSKSVQFDGQILLTRSPSAILYPCQTNRAARTPASAIPILGPLVAEYALGVAEQSRPAAERITAERITQQVVPQFNDAIDQRLTSLNAQLTDQIPKLLPRLGIITPSTRVRTTEHQLTVSFAWDTVRNCPEYVTTPPAPKASEFRIAVHSEAVNVWLASLPLGGMEIPLRDLDRWQKELEQVLSSDHSGRRSISQVPRATTAARVRIRTVGQTEAVPGLGELTILGPLLVPPREQVDKVPTIAEPEGEPSPAADAETPLASQALMILAPEAPVTVEFARGEAVITLVAAFRIAPAPQTDYHRIRIPLTSQIMPDELIVTTGRVQVETTTPSTGPLSELMRATIEKEVQQRLRPTQWPITRQIERDQGQPVTLQLGEVSSAEGWLSLVWGLNSQRIEGVSKP